MNVSVAGRGSDRISREALNRAFDGLEIGGTFWRPKAWVLRRAGPFSLEEGDHCLEHEVLGTVQYNIWDKHRTARDYPSKTYGTGLIIQLSQTQVNMLAE